MDPKKKAKQHKTGTVRPGHTAHHTYVEKLLQKHIQLLKQSGEERKREKEDRRGFKGEEEEGA